MRSRARIANGLLAAGLGLTLGAALAGCSDGSGSGSADTGTLTRQQYDAAVNVARHEVENQDAEVTSASAVLVRNRAPHAPTNTGHRCTGDRVLRIRLIGTFPHAVTTGTPGGGSSTVTEMDIKADPASGEACLIGVGTDPHPAPEQGATVLQLDG